MQSGDVFTMLGTNYEVKHVKYDGLLIELETEAVLITQRTQLFVTISLHEFTNVSVFG